MRQAIGRVHVETWQSTYAGMLPDAMLVRMSEARQAAWWSRSLADPREARGVFVADDEDMGVVGFGSCGPVRDPPDGLNGTEQRVGEVYTLYVESDFQNLGLGRRLLDAMFRQLKADGFDTAVLWMLARNSTRFFYEGLGGDLVGQRTDRMGGEPVDEVAYAWRDLDAPLVRRKAGAGGGGMTPPRPVPKRSRGTLSCDVCRYGRSLGYARDDGDVAVPAAPLISAHERPTADRRFRFPGHPADRPARARGRGLLRDPSVPIRRRREDRAVRPARHHPVRRPGLGDRGPVARRQSRRLRRQRAGAGHLLRRADHGAAARRPGRGRPPPRVRPRRGRGQGEVARCSTACGSRATASRSG